MAPGLADKFRLILVDHRSHGMSSMSRARYEIEGLADDVAGVLDELGIGRTSVVGYSMGGAIAQALAHRHPRRIDKLVLMATLAFTPEPDRTARMVGAVLVRAWERLTGLGTPDVRAGYLLATGSVAEEHARWLWDETHRRDVEAGAQATLALMRFDSRPWVGRLDQPTMVVIPTKDQLIPPAWQYELAALLADPVVVELPGVRHEAPWAVPERLVEEIVGFVG